MIENRLLREEERRHNYYRCLQREHVCSDSLVVFFFFLSSSSHKSFVRSSSLNFVGSCAERQSTSPEAGINKKKKYGDAGCISSALLIPVFLARHDSASELRDVTLRIYSTRRRHPPHLHLPPSSC